MTEWKKVENSETHDFEVSKEVEGIYTGLKTNVGANGSNIYELETKNGKTGVWGSTVIDTKMSNVKLGEEVKIVFLGKMTNEKTKRTYKNFEVFHKDVNTKKSDELNIDNFTLDLDQ